MAYRPEFISAVEEEQRANIARLTAELAAVRREAGAMIAEQDKEYSQTTNGMILRHTAQISKLIARAEAAEALLGAAYRAGLEDAAKSAGTYCHLRTVQGGRLKSPAVFTTHTWQEIQECIRALPVPADLAARLAKEAGE